jgi:hypothetical protein
MLVTVRCSTSGTWFPQSGKKRDKKNKTFVGRHRDDDENVRREAVKKS